MIKVFSTFWYIFNMIFIYVFSLYVTIVIKYFYHALEQSK